MRNEIVEKLNKELSSLPIDTEPRTMYLLVQIRKIMDHVNDRNNPLRFYCNWVVHSALYKQSAQQKLKELNEMTDDQVHKFINLIELRKHLKEFLNEHDLNDELTNIEKYWISFREQLIKVLIDTPIEQSDSGISYFALQKRNLASATGVRRIEYRMIRDNKEILGNLYSS